VRENYQALCEHVLDLARKAGADEAEVMLGAGDEFSVTVRRGEVEKLIEAGSRTLGLRVFKNGRTSSTYSADLTPAALAHFVERAVDLASIADPDPFAGLPEWEERPSLPDLKLSDPAVAALSADEKIAQALRCEQSAFDLDPRITNSDGASFGTDVSTLVLLNSRGFSGSYESSYASLAIEVMADDADGKKRNDHWFSIERALDRLESPEEIGRKAAERALRRLGARKVATKAVPVVFDPLAAAGLLRTVAGAASGAALDRLSTFLIGSENNKVGSDLLTLTDDALIPGRLGSRPFDDEGVASRVNPIFEGGAFRGYLFDTYTAKKTGHQSTGNCRRSIGGPPSVGTSNLYLQPGTAMPEEILSSVEDGLYVTDMMGFGVNLTTGDFSRGAAGLWIERGRLAYPVTEITISGNLRQMLQDLEMTGSDLEWRGSMAAPTIKLRSMMVSGL
jgi:PmbA protein